MCDFKKRVLDPAIKQINEHTDITIKVEQHKTGRSITGLMITSHSMASSHSQDTSLRTGLTS